MKFEVEKIVILPFPFFNAYCKAVDFTGPAFSVAFGGGNLNTDKPGNFVSTLGIDAGIAFAFGGSLWDGEGGRLLVLFVDGADNSRRAGKLFPWSTEWETAFEELGIVVKNGLIGCSGFEDAVGGVEETGSCSTTVSLELLAEVDIDIGGGFLFLLGTSEPEDSKLELLLPPAPCTLARVETGVFDLDSALDVDERTSRNVGVSPRCNFASTSRSVTCRLSGVPSLRLRSLPARLLFTLSFPSIIFAGGGG
jgi:hypothetical protein